MKTPPDLVNTAPVLGAALLAAAVLAAAPARPVRAPDPPSAALLALLPDGEEKRRFVLDCTGCHVFDERLVLPGGQPRSAADWASAVRRMLEFAGPESGFPVIAAGRDPESTAAFLTAALYAGDTLRSVPSRPLPAAGTITEYDLPEARDLPHDLALLEDGRVLITGMFTHRMYLLDPEDRAIETIPIPVRNANPRAVELDAEGDWWVVLGGPHQLAEYDVRAQRWHTHDVGVYPHSLAVGKDGRVWYNGHFTRAPQVLGAVDPAAGDVSVLEVPAHPEAGRGAGPIPYELRAAPDGSIWGSELVGNRIYRYEPDSRSFTTYDMPVAHSGPRRLDVAPDGSVWIPEFAAGALVRLDPAAGTFERFPLPVPDAAPYVARLDPRSGDVWVGTGAADAVFRFRPATGTFDAYPLPTRGALVRHLVVAPAGDVWLAYGASPGGPARIARLRP